MVCADKTIMPQVEALKKVMSQWLTRLVFSHI